MWIDPIDRLWLIWAVMPNHSVWASICENPDADILEWSSPRMIGKDVMMNKPTVISSGEWLFPIAVWDKSIVAGGFASKTRDKKAFVYRSGDNGKTFKKLGGVKAPNRSFDEHMIVELSDNSLMMFIRTTFGIAKSYSFDAGITWTQAENTNIESPCSRFFITRLQSGNLLLVNNCHKTRRTNLTAMLSEDDGKTWKGTLLLDERDDVSYPDGVEAGDGYIYITYDRERGGFQPSKRKALRCAREILFAKFTEADIFAGKIVSKEGKLKQIINKLGKYNGDMKEWGIPSDENDLDKYLLDLTESYEKENIIAKIFDDFDLSCVNACRINSEKFDKLINEFYKTKNTDSLKDICLMLIDVNAESADKTNELFNDIKTYIQKNITSEFTLDNIAEHLKYSKFYIIHIFKKKSGIPIKRYILSERIRLSKKYLSESNISITDICIKIGMNNAPYFAKCFKRFEGITPSEYRNQRKKVIRKGKIYV